MNDYKDSEIIKPLATPDHRVSEIDTDHASSNIESRVTRTLTDEEMRSAHTIYSRGSRELAAYASPLSVNLQDKFALEKLSDASIIKIVIEKDNIPAGIAIVSEDISSSSILSKEYLNNLKSSTENTQVVIIEDVQIDPNCDDIEKIQSELLLKIEDEIITSDRGYLLFTDTEESHSPIRDITLPKYNSNILFTEINKDTGVDQEECFLCQWSEKPSQEIIRTYECKTTSIIDPDSLVSHQIWEMSQEITTPLSTETPFTQFYPRDIFDKIMTDEDVTKYLLMDNEILVGFGLMTKKLENEPLLSTNSIKSLSYVNSFGKVPCNLIMFIGTKPGLKDFNAITELLGDMMCSIEKNETGMFLYSKQHNPAIPRLATLVARKRNGQISSKLIGAKTCHIIKWNKEKGVSNE
jgi:hypothetical protein